MRQIYLTQSMNLESRQSHDANRRLRCFLPCSCPQHDAWSKQKLLSPDTSTCANHPQGTNAQSPGANPLETLVTGNSPISFPKLPLFQTGLATSLFKVEAEALQVPCCGGAACGGMAVLAHPNSEWCPPHSSLCTRKCSCIQALEKGH